MKDHDYKFGHFKWIEHEDHPEIVEKIRERFKDSGIIDLLTELDHMENEPNLTAEIQEMKLLTIKRLIAIKLDLFDNEHGNFLVDTLPGYVKNNEGQIRKLEKKYLIHRHDKDKSFSGVPIE